MSHRKWRETKPQLIWWPGQAASFLSIPCSTSWHRSRYWSATLIAKLTKWCLRPDGPPCIVLLTDLHELDAGVEGVVEPEEEQKRLLHRQDLRELQKSRKGSSWAWLKLKAMSSNNQERVGRTRIAIQFYDAIWAKTIFELLNMRPSVVRFAFVLLRDFGSLLTRL